MNPRRSFRHVCAPAVARPAPWLTPLSARLLARPHTLIASRHPGLLAGALILCTLLGVFGCRRGSSSDETSPVASSEKELPPLELRDDTPKLLLTWVDEKGDFHVVQKTPEVPEAARANVRVVVTDREAGTGQTVYVADLRKKNPGGSYPVRTLPRAEWEEMGASKRKARLETLAPSALAARSASAAPSASATAQKPLAIVYGADWCKACRDAEKYLVKRGASVVHKDIERSAAAQAEMKEKLRRAGLPITAQIPVLDVAGEIQLGFSPPAVDRALSRNQSAQGT
jgi:hypothetical protein